LSLEIISTTMLIGVISILYRFLEIPLIIMVIPVAIHIIIIIGYPLILKVILNNLLIHKIISML
jgi:hypothetical protein